MKPSVATGDMAVLTNPAARPRLGAGRKSFVVSITLRSPTGTLSGDEAGRIVDGVVAECGRRAGAVLRGS